DDLAAREQLVHVEEVAKVALGARADVAGAAVHAEDVSDLLAHLRRERILVGVVGRSVFVHGVRAGRVRRVAGRTALVTTRGRARLVTVDVALVGRGGRIDVVLQARVDLTEGARHCENGGAEAQGDGSQLSPTNSRRHFR